MSSSDTNLYKPNRREALFSGAGLVGIRAGLAVAGGLVSARTVAARDRGNCDRDLPVSQINAVFGVDGMLEPGGVLVFRF